MLRIQPLILDSESRALYVRFVPASHPLRQFDDCLDFSFILPLVAERYHDEIGRPAEHPEQMYRLLFAKFSLNLSDEKICLTAHESLALRPFLRLGVRQTAGILPVGRLFTGQIWDLGNDGFYFFKARYNDAAIGKFHTTDTIVPEPINPQALNRYAYTLNNPLRYADPTGHDVADWFNDQWVDEFHAHHQGRDPDANDYAWRFWSMADASGMINQYADNYGVDPKSLAFTVPRTADGAARDVDLGQDYGEAQRASRIEWISWVVPNGRWDHKQMSHFQFEGGAPPLVRL